MAVFASGTGATSGIVGSTVTPSELDDLNRIVLEQDERLDRIESQVDRLACLRLSEYLGTDPRACSVQ